MNSNSFHQVRDFRGRRACAWAAAIALCGITELAGAASMDQARRIHHRLTGITPAPAVLEAMIQKIETGDALGAAYQAMDNPAFCNVMLKDWIAPWTNEEMNPQVDLNDYTATVIGIIRDDIPFTQVLSGDIVFVGAEAMQNGQVNDDYSQTNNDHYIQLQASGADLCDPTVLVQTRQSALPDAVISPQTAAGVLTTRAAAAAFFSGGTNRAMWRFTSLHYLCKDMEQLKDITRPSDRVRQDVSRSPGGSSGTFLSHCVGCHSGMDPMTGAFAYYSYDEDEGRLVYTPGQVQEKFLINASAFEYGYVTRDDSWENYWRAGKNVALGWDSARPGKGNGAKSLGEEVAASRAFSTCQVEKAFERVCYRPVQTQADYNARDRIADAFEQSNYNYKRVLAETAVYCQGD